MIALAVGVLIGFCVGVPAGWHMRPETYRFLPSRRLHRR